MKIEMKFLAAVAGAIAVLGAFSGCQTDITGTIDSSGRAVLNVNSAFMPNTNTLIKKLGGLTGAAGDGAALHIIDADILNESLTKGGIEKATFKNKTSAAGAEALSGELVVSKIDNLTGGGVIVTATGGRASFYIDRENGPAFLEAISPELCEYLKALMAPIADGADTDITDKKNYLENITMVYGSAVAKEINSASVKLNLKFPAPVKNISGGGTANGNNAVFKIPLIDLLVLEEAVSYEIIWGK
jgi:hypothetical protein